MPEDSGEKAVFAWKGTKMTVLITYCILAAILLVGSMCLEMKRKPIPEGIELMDKQHTEVIKGIAIMCVVLSHVGNANGTRAFAPGGGLV